MTRRTKLSVLMAMTAILTACDRADRTDLRSERADGLYKSAMDDFQSGRIDAAVKGFEKAIARDPGNASARFQLACIQQDAKRDYLAAFCGYREYLMQHPESDKAGMAKDRMAICEKEMAKALATRFGLMGSEGFAKELENVRQELKATGTRLAAADKDLATYRTRVEALTAERNRLIAIVKGGGVESETATAAAPSVKEAKDLLDEEDESTDRAKLAKEVAELKAEAEVDSADRIKMSKDVAALKTEEKGEVESGATILPQQTQADRDRRDAAKAEMEKRRQQQKEKALAEDAAVPETYVVQESDTLYRIAKRFYGRISAWRAIREANKAKISMDGRVRVGDKLVLPRPGK